MTSGAHPFLLSGQGALAGELALGFQVVGTMATSGKVLSTSCSRPGSAQLGVMGEVLTQGPREGWQLAGHAPQGTRAILVSTFPTAAGGNVEDPLNGPR